VLYQALREVNLTFVDGRTGSNAAGIGVRRFKPSKLVRGYQQDVDALSLPAGHLHLMYVTPGKLEDYAIYVRMAPSVKGSIDIASG
jgi:hypothetical protein